MVCTYPPTPAEIKDIDTLFPLKDEDGNTFSRVTSSTPLIVDKGSKSFLRDHGVSPCKERYFSP